jgi:hypothetical protein
MQMRMIKDIKDNRVVCNATLLKIFLGKTHPCEKPQNEKKSAAQLL